MNWVKWWFMGTPDLFLQQSECIVDNRLMYIECGLPLNSIDLPVENKSIFTFCKVPILASVAISVNHLSNVKLKSEAEA